MNKYDGDVFNAETAHHELEFELNDSVDAFRTQERARMESRFAVADRTIKVAKEKWAAEQVLLDAAAVTEALRDKRIGKIYVEWENVGFAMKARQTGKRGICEVMTDEHKKLSHGDKATTGKLCFRQLKKDGSPSKIFHVFKLNWSAGESEPPWGWYPEGVDR